MSPLMGGFSLVCAGVAPPEIVKEEGYLFAAYPRFHARSVALKRYLDPPSDRQVPQTKVKSPRKLREVHEITLGRERLRLWMIEAGIWSARKQRRERGSSAAPSARVRQRAGAGRRLRALVV
jgi:hypothetical protein